MIESMLIGSLLGKEFISQTITSTTNTTYNNFLELVSNKEFKFNHLIEKLDIKSKIKIIEKLIIEINQKKLHQTDTIHLALVDLHEIIEKINNELNEVNKKYKIYEQSWFKFLQTNPYSILIKSLTNHNNIMEKRLDLLLKLLTVT